jgi:drug/metabolite transporter (DMT)-like permease
MTGKAEESTERMLGAILVTASAAVFGLAGAMTKAIAADPLTITCWRGLFGGLLVSVYVMWRRRSGNGASLRLGWRGWLLALVGAVASIAFISAFKAGFVANVAIIYATVPFAAALLSLLMLGERFRLQTLVAALVSMAGVSVMVFSGLSGGSPLGDALALGMTFLAALYMVLIRKFRDTPVVWSGAVSAFLLFGFGWLVTDPLAVTSRDMLLLAAFGVSFAFAVILWTEGARLIPSSEAGLLGSAEVPFAILFAWLILAEAPPYASLLGGAIVLSAVLGHGYLDWLRSRPAALELRSRRIADAQAPVK